MKKIIMLGTVLVLGGFTGCVSTKEITHSNLKSIKQSNFNSIIISKRKKPDFLATTVVNVQFGMIGLAQQISAGNKRIRENNVEDPAVYIANELGADLGRTLGIEKIQISSSEAESTNVNKLSEQYAGTDLLLDVQTIGWQSTYYLSDLNNYRVVYNGVIRLIDTKDKVILAQSHCSKKQDDKKNSPSYDQLFENNAAILKAALKEHADSCIAEFKAKVANTIL